MRLKAVLNDYYPKSSIRMEPKTMDLKQTVQMFDNLNAAIVACDADYKVIY